MNALRPMTEHDKPKFNRLWLDLATATRRYSEGGTLAERYVARTQAIRVYWETLRELPLSAVDQAARRLRHEYVFPVAGRWFALADRIAADEASSPLAVGMEPETSEGERIREARAGFVREYRALLGDDTLLQGVLDAPIRVPRPPHCERCTDTGWVDHRCAGGGVLWEAHLRGAGCR